MMPESPAIPPTTRDFRFALAFGVKRGRASMRCLSEIAGNHRSSLSGGTVEAPVRLGLGVHDRDEDRYRRQLAAGAALRSSRETRWPGSYITAGRHRRQGPLETGRRKVSIARLRSGRRQSADGSASPRTIILNLLAQGDKASGARPQARGSRSRSATIPAGAVGSAILSRSRR